MTNFDAIPLPVPEEVDAEEVIADFNRFKRAVPLKLSSAESEIVFKQRDGAPALSWVVSLSKSRVGVIARFESVPRALLARAEKTRLVFKPEYDGARLKGVAVSGAGFTPPGSLEEFTTALMSESPGETVDRRARTLAAEKTLTYSEAVKQVLVDHPDLAGRYIRGDR